MKLWPYGGIEMSKIIAVIIMLPMSISYFQVPAFLRYIIQKKN